jgi:hypothetical protein
VPDSAARQLDLVAASAVRDAVLRRIGDDPARRVRLQALAKVILDNVTPGSKFSLNDVRDHIPADVVRPQDRGPLMARLCLLGVLVRVGDEPSTAERTNGKPIARYVLRDPSAVEDAPAIRVGRRNYGAGGRWAADWPAGRIEHRDREVLDQLVAAIAQQTGLPVVDVPHIDRPAGRASRTPRQEGRPA